MENRLYWFLVGKTKNYFMLRAMFRYAYGRGLKLLSPEMVKAAVTSDVLPLF